MSKKPQRMSAVFAERMFGVVIVLLLISLVADFVYVTGLLKSKANDTQILRLKAETSDKDISELKSAKQWLEEQQDTIERVDAVVAQSKLYQYQNQIINDFDSYANRAGLEVLGYAFTSTSEASTPATGGATPQAPPTTPAPTPDGSTPGAATAPAVGLNSTTVTITFQTKARYTGFIRMLRLIESNVTRMQVTDISLGPDGDNTEFISNPTVNVLVYIKDKGAL